MPGIEVSEVSKDSFKIEVGRIARQADGSALITFGDTKVLVTVIRGEAEELDYFPLIVDYEERFYAGGKIPGGFMKREGKPSDEAVLNARMIDRPIRPLFPKNYRERVHIVVTVFSADKDHPPEIAGMLGASTALMVSSVPFQEPIAGARVGKINGRFIVNPTSQEREISDLDIVVAGTSKAVTMVEGSMKELPEEEVLESIELAHEYIKELIELQEEFTSKLRVEKVEVPEEGKERFNLKELKVELSEIIGDGFEALRKAERKLEQGEMIDSLKEEVVDRLLEERLRSNLFNLKLEPQELSEEEIAQLKRDAAELFDELLKEFIRRTTLERGVRIDNRKPDEIRPVSCEVGVLPRVHGSSLFTRGETQSLGTCTLGTTRQDEQIIDRMLEEGRKRFMLHYNFPPFSVGETRRLGPPSRREIGHGHLAEKALRPVLPGEEEFPYIIRVVSEILESNGSSSMATVCSSSLALMDAGVPIRKPVAGIAMGLIEEGSTHLILTDIVGLEDRCGDMDFKVAGTRDGLTALQMDIKAEGLPRKVMEEALERAREARNKVLDIMEATIARPRHQLSPYAPILELIKVDPDKVGTVIGPGGRTVRYIIDKTGVEIDIEDDGTVKISGDSKDAVKEAREMIEELTEEIEVGKRFKGKVTRTERYGAFVEIKDGVRGMVHISDLSDNYVKNVEDVVRVGDEITVEVTGIDEMGRPDLRRVSDSERKINVGDTLAGTVKNTTDFGAFVELDELDEVGLIHISELSDGYVKQVEDVVKPGDRVLVKVIRIDSKGRYYLRRISRDDMQFEAL